MIGIIDYGTGNLRSVYNAFKYIGQDIKIFDDPAEFSAFEKIVLPGVGSSKDAMEGLKQKALIEPLLGTIAEGKPFLGICLGLQLLFKKSSETGGCDCLGIIDGEVRLFSPDAGLKVPQIGWNNVAIEKKDCPLFEGIDDNSYFYFVHSYFCDSNEPDHTAGVTTYGQDYVSALWKDNIFAVQFHPERSQKNGLKILENFSKL